MLAGSQMQLLTRQVPLQRKSQNAMDRMQSLASIHTTVPVHSI